MADTPQEQLAARVFGLWTTRQFRPAHTPQELEREGHAPDAVTRAITTAREWLRLQSGGPLGRNSARARLIPVWHLLAAEARATGLTLPEMTRNTRPTGRREVAEALRRAVAATGWSVPRTHDLLEDVASIVQRTEDALSRGEMLRPEALQALDVLIRRAVGFEWTGETHAKELS